MSKLKKSEQEIQELSDRIFEICEEHGLVSLVYIVAGGTVINHITGHVPFLQVGMSELKEHIEEEG